MTGAAMSKSRRKRRIGNPSRRDDRIGTEDFDRPAQRQMDGHRDDSQFRAGQHHDRDDAGAGQLGQIFGVAGMAKPGPIEGVLVDRIGHDRRRPPGTNVGDGGVDRADDRRHVGGVGLSRAAAHRCPERRYRKRRDKDFGRLRGIGDRPDRHPPIEPSRQPGQPLGVVDHIELRHSRGAAEPGLERNFAANAGGLPHRQGERQGHPAHTLTSTNAVRRRSRR